MTSLKNFSGQVIKNTHTHTHTTNSKAPVALKISLNLHSCDVTALFPVYTSLLLLPFRNRVSRCYLSSFLLPFYFSFLFILFHWNVLYIFSFYQVMAEFWGWFLIILCFILDIPSFVIIVIMIIISFIVTFLIFILPGTVSDMEKRPLEVITIHYQAAFLIGVSHSVVSNSFATPWTITCQAPLSMGGCPFLHQGIFQTQRSKLHPLCLLYW